jgi:purine-binding chemotaxis protein CheW
MSDNTTLMDEDVTEYVTIVIGDQLFGLPISRVHDVFMPERLTRVPLAAPEISGVLNLRGRIVTAIDMRVRLGLPPREDGKVSMAVGIESRGEAFGLLIDTVGEVMKVSATTREPTPVNLDARWVKVAKGVHRLDGKLLVILDVDQVLGTENDLVAA